LFLIQCYYLSLTQLDKRPRLTQYWVPVQQACQGIMDDPAVDVPTLVAIGQAQKENLSHLQGFLKRRLVSDDEFKAMAVDLLTRQKVLWEDVLRRDPRNVWGYIGLAEFHYGTGNPPAAVQMAVTGLKECGAVPD